MIDAITTLHPIVVAPRVRVDCGLVLLHSPAPCGFHDRTVVENKERTTMTAAQPPLGPQAFRAFLAQDVKKWEKLVHDADIKLE